MNRCLRNIHHDFSKSLLYELIPAAFIFPVGSDVLNLSLDTWNKSIQGAWNYWVQESPQEFQELPPRRAQRSTPNSLVWAVITMNWVKSNTAYRGDVDKGSLAFLSTTNRWEVIAETLDIPKTLLPHRNLLPPNHCSQSPGTSVYTPGVRPFVLQHQVWSPSAISFSPVARKPLSRKTKSKMASPLLAPDSCWTFTAGCTLPHEATILFGVFFSAFFLKKIAPFPLPQILTETIVSHQLITTSFGS